MVGDRLYGDAAAELGGEGGGGGEARASFRGSPQLALHAARVAFPSHVGELGDDEHQTAAAREMLAFETEPSDWDELFHLARNDP